MKKSLYAAIAVSIVLVSACSDDSGSSVICETGASRECACANGQKGAQTCEGTDKGWGECVCEDIGPEAIATLCKDVDCTEHGVCVVGSTGALCLCMDGYVSTMGKSGPTCVEGSTPVVADNCEGVTCSNHGTCISTASGAACICNSGYESSVGEDSKPICTQTQSSSGACSGVTCGDHGQCLETAGGAACLCDDGYASGVDEKGALTCKAKGGASVCSAIDCGGNGNCIEASSGAACVCNDGYNSNVDADGKPTCTDSAESGPCKDITCGGDGSCVVTADKSASCICNSGFLAKNDANPPTCERDTSGTSPCTDVDCSGHGTCLVTGDNAAYCSCATGFINGTATTCVEENSACNGVSCSDHGTCIVTSNNSPYCLCDSGYINDGEKACVQGVSACSGVSCSDRGTCIVTSNNSPYCLCDSGYMNSGDTSCIQDSSPCNGVSCSDHGVCIVTSNNSAYCLCDSGYEQSGSTACKQSASVNPCASEKCSDHGTCLVTGSNEPFCLCDDQYKNDGATKCVSEYGVSKGQAYPTETIDPWGLVWDSQERPAQTHSNAAATCASIGGRLPSPFEIVRNNHESGEKGVGNSTNVNVLWTDMRTWDNYFRAYRLSNGTNADQVITTPVAFRCVWDPSTRPITFTGVNCYGKSTEDGCVNIKVGTHKYTVDRRDRPAQPWVQAAEECRLSGGRLPTNNEMMMLIRNGLPNGTNNWVWSSATDGNFGVHRWSGIGPSSYDYSGNWSQAAWSASYYYRCISEEVELTDGNPTFPQTKAADAFVVDPLLRVDKTPRAAKTVWEAYYDCMQDGGHLAQLDEMTLAIRKGLNVSESWHQTSTQYGGYNFVIRGNAKYVAPYYNQNGNITNSHITTSYPYYCAYRPNRVYDEADFEKKATDGYAWKYEQKFDKAVVKYFVREKGEATAGGADCIQDSITAASKGMFLPTDGELMFAIRHGLPGGNGAYLMTSTTNGWLTYRVIKWSGTEGESFDPNANYSAVNWNANNGYRSFISSVIK